MDHSLDFIELLGASGVIHGVSSAITALAGYAPTDLVGRHYADFIHADDVALVTDAFTQLLKKERAGPITLRYRCKDGAWRTIQASARNHIADPAVRALIVLTRDVTDQLEAERSLSQANAELHRLSQRLISAHEEERAHLGRELHDDVGQILVGLSLSIASGSGAAGMAPVAQQIGAWRRLVEEALEHLRALVLDLRPPALEELGLAAALTAHVEHVRTLTGSDISLVVAADLGRLAPDIEITCFRIVQEALTNAIRHSDGSHFQVRLRRVDRTLHVTVRDDGMGFDVGTARDRAVREGRIGLLSMRERATLVGGHLDIHSSPGQGAEVRATLPIQPAVGGSES
jgi:two-component system sensor histidine kinase UhpB